MQEIELAEPADGRRSTGKLPQTRLQLLMSRTALTVSVLYLLLSLIIALSWRIRPLEAMIPQLLKLHPLDKSNLDPFRLLHFLALAVLAARFMPRNWPGPMMPVTRGAILCGQNSLPTYCLGVLLSFAADVARLDISDGLAMQITSHG